MHIVSSLGQTGEVYSRKLLSEQDDIELHHCNCTILKLTCTAHFHPKLSIILWLFVQNSFRWSCHMHMVTILF